jgi:NADH:quinone reductase (non-electrogenic)
MKTRVTELLGIRYPINDTARVFENAISDEVVAIERRPGGAAFDDLRPLVAGGRRREALRSGKVDAIPSCAELIQTLVRECRAQLQRASAMVAPQA